jgi:hypothetical protein
MQGSRYKVVNRTYRAAGPVTKEGFKVDILSPDSPQGDVPVGSLSFVPPFRIL